MKLRTGEPTEKEIIAAFVQVALEKSLSLHSFVDQLKAGGYEVYTRNGVPYGIVGKRRYRFTSFGISLERLNPEKSRTLKGYER